MDAGVIIDTCNPDFTEIVAMSTRNQSCGTLPCVVRPGNSKPGLTPLATHVDMFNLPQRRAAKFTGEAAWMPGMHKVAAIFDGGADKRKNTAQAGLTNVLWKNPAVIGPLVFLIDPGNRLILRVTNLYI